MADGQSYTTRGEDEKLALSRHSAAIAKYTGDLAAARHHAWKALLSSPQEGASWCLLASTMFGAVARAQLSAALSGRHKQPSPTVAGAPDSR
jgi:hypothetical protein